LHTLVHDQTDVLTKHATSVIIWEMPCSKLHMEVEREEQEIGDNQTATVTNCGIRKKLRQSP